MCMVFFFFKQKTAYEMRISDWSSDVCSSDLRAGGTQVGGALQAPEPGDFDRITVTIMANGTDLATYAVDRRGQWLLPLPNASPPFGPGPPPRTAPVTVDRKSVVSGKSVSVRVDLGGRRIIKKKNNKYETRNNSIYEKSNNK